MPPKTPADNRAVGHNLNQANMGIAANKRAGPQTRKARIRFGKRNGCMAKYPEFSARHANITHFMVLTLPNLNLGVISLSTLKQPQLRLRSLQQFLRAGYVLRRDVDRALWLGGRTLGGLAGWYRGQALFHLAALGLGAFVG